MVKVLEYYQMMDMYYGNNSDFWKGRDELIAHFIHHALKMPGSFDKDTSGRESYLKGYGTVLKRFRRQSAIHIQMHSD